MRATIFFTSSILMSLSHYHKYCVCKTKVLENHNVLEVCTICIKFSLSGCIGNIFKSTQNSHRIFISQCIFYFILSSEINAYQKQIKMISITIGIKHVFPCINIHWVPREVLKTSGATSPEEPSEC